jgi:antitoxin (DNA-binding transcriptional repressor) of toxin-antitoxin stability system
MAKVATLSITEARKEFLGLPEKFTKDKDLKSIIITKRGEPVFDLVPHGYIETIVETLEIMSDPDQLAALRQSIQDVKKGRLFTTEEVEDKLGL